MCHCMIKENQRHFNKLLICADALVIFLSINISYCIRFNYTKNAFVQNDYLFNYYILPLILMIPVYIIIFNIFDLYSTYRSKKIVDEVLNIVKCNIFVMLIFVLMLYFMKRVNYSRYLIIIFFVVSNILICGERILLRLILRNIRSKGYNIKHVIFAGINGMTGKLINEIEKNKHWGYDIEAILCEDSVKNSFEEIAAEIADCSSNYIKTLDTMENLQKYLATTCIDEVFITLPSNEYGRTALVVNACEKAGVKCSIVPDFFDMISSKPYIGEVGNVPIVGMRYVPLDNLFNKMIKRIFDILLSGFAILILSPIMILTVLIIKFTSPGPIIFRQERVGLNKKIFTMYKFRSMRVQDSSKEKFEWTTQDDPRKTKFGTFIRKTSIDELPQFFNVLKGDMSMIGPRPERPHFVRKFSEEVPKYMVKHQVRPGITGWAQVNGWRGNTSIEKRIQCDIYYIENWTFKFDIKIAFLTVFKGFVNKNAY